MGRVGFSCNNAREHFASDAGRYDTNGNPTPTPTEPLVDGGQFAPQSRRQRLRQRLHQREMAVQRQRDVSGAVRHRGQRQRLRPAGLSVSRCSAAAAALGGDSALSVLVTPTMDYFRYDNLWDTDVRLARTFKFPSLSRARDRRPLQHLQREHRARPEQQHPATTFNAIVQNLSPRIFRIGVEVNF